MSTRIFQSIIIQMKEATTRTIGVIDPEGFVVANSELSLIGNNFGYPHVFYDDEKDKTVRMSGRTYKALGTGASDDYTVYVDGEDELARMVCIMAAVAINEAGIYFKENHDKRAYVKSVLSENILPNDIHVRAGELRLSADVPRGVLVLRHASHFDSSVVDLLENLLPEKQHDFVISLNETDIAVIKEMLPSEDTDSLYKLAEEILRKLGIKPASKIVIGIGAKALQLRELPERYREALLAIEIGKVFENDKNILSFENLGIGRLIYQLPVKLCEIYLSEIFKDNQIEALDKEILVTIDKFFENSLNVSETSRKLFVHRNTLVYRLEKIRKITGLDLREFDHAIIFKVALMVKKYLVSQESKYK